MPLPLIAAVPAVVWWVGVPVVVGGGGWTVYRVFFAG